jgi:glycosyltransferase involved in cell wall biosynthesis
VLLHPSLTARGGGIELYGRDLLAALANLEPEAEITAVLGDEPALAHPELLAPQLRRRLRVSGTEGVFLKRVLSMSLRVGLAVRDRPEMVVCGHLNYAPLAWAAARATGARLVQLLYGVEAWSPGALLPRLATRRMDRVLAISRFTADAAELALGLSGVGILHNAVDTARFSPGRPPAELARRLPPGPRVLTVSRLNAREGYKGVDVVLRALREVRASYVVVGAGSDVPRLEKLARELGVTAYFHGRASEEELPDLYRACDLFVMPSRGEGFGYVFLEALASGLPVVAGNADGSVDALAGGELGLLVDPSDHRAVAEAIRAHLEGRSPPQLRDGARLHAEVERRFGRATHPERVRMAFAP